MLQNLINSLNREQLLAAMNDPSVTEETLRAALLHCLNGAAPAPVATVAATEAAAKKAAAAARAAMAKAKPAPAPAPVAPLAAAGAPAPADAIVNALCIGGTGFAVADVIAAGAEFAVTRSQASGAIKRACKAGTLFGFGSRRFSRYGASIAIATAASVAAHG